MPLTSNWNIWTPDDADNYDFIVDSAATAQTVDDALTQVETDLAATLGAGANLYVGTAAERAAFTPAPEGALWQDTDSTTRLWQGVGGAWAVRNPHATVIGTSTQAIPNPAGAEISWASAESDTGGMFNVSNPTRLTAPVAGRYRFTASVSVVGGGIGGKLVLKANGTLVERVGAIAGPPSGWAMQLNVSGEVTLTAGQYVEAYCLFTTSATIDRTKSFMSLERIW